MRRTDRKVLRSWNTADGVRIVPATHDRRERSLRRLALPERRMPAKTCSISRSALSAGVASRDAFRVTELAEHCCEPIPTGRSRKSSVAAARFRTALRLLAIELRYAFQAFPPLRPRGFRRPALEVFGGFGKVTRRHISFVGKEIRPRSNISKKGQKNFVPVALTASVHRE